MCNASDGVFKNSVSRFLVLEFTTEVAEAEVESENGPLWPTTEPATP